MTPNLALVALSCLLALAASGGRQVCASIKVHSPVHLERLFNFDNSNQQGDRLDPFDLLLEDIIPTWFGQRPNNENGTRPEFKAYALMDDSNDDALRLNSQKLLARSGYKFQTYDTVAGDGYITQLTRVINPLADPTRLRQPPILMEHGGSIDPTAYIVASSIQHFPERYPRTANDGPWRSWNRSLAFYLANSGFDVWLAETRGSNEKNKRHIKSKTFESFVDGKFKMANMTVMEQVKEVVQSLEFWAFSQDDIIAHELKSHMDAVLNLTKSTRLNLMTFSLSTTTSLAFLGTRPDYAEKVHGYVSMAPIVSGEGTSKFVRLIFQTICPLVPDDIGTLLLTDILFTQPARELFVLISRNKYSRYIILKSITTMLMGPSAKWQTLLDLNLIGHLFRQLSFKEMKQMCQQMSNNKLQKFDYGPVKNKLLYGSVHPPVYDISDLKISDWLVVSGSNDALSTPQVYEHLMSIVNPKPIAHVIAPNFNHLDLFAGWNNDIYVNEPIKKYFELMTYVPGQTPPSEQAGSGARGLDLSKFLQPDVSNMLDPAKLIGDASSTVTKVAGETEKLTSGGGSEGEKGIGEKLKSKLNPAKLVETLAKTFQTMAAALGGDFGKLFQTKVSGLGLKSGARSMQLTPPMVDEPNNNSSSENAEEDDDKQTGDSTGSSPKKEKGFKAANSNPAFGLLGGIKNPAIENLANNITKFFDLTKVMGNLGQTLKLKPMGATGNSSASSGLGSGLNKFKESFNGLTGGLKQGGQSSGLAGLFKFPMIGSGN